MESIITLILKESEIGSLINLLDNYKVKVIMMTNSTDLPIMKKINDLKSNIIFQCNRKLNIKD